MDLDRPRSPLSLVVLSLVCEAPMHPYRMQTLIKERGKDLVANVAQRNSVYQTIAALERAGLIEVRETSQDEKRPEKTIYEATALGRKTLHGWLRTILATPAREFPDFPAALSLLDQTFTAKELATLLETRASAVKVRLEALEKPVPGLPRLFLLESEYMAAVARAELDWLRGVIADLHKGRLKFPSQKELQKLAATFQTENEPRRPRRKT